jgi:hypothetical protein
MSGDLLSTGATASDASRVGAGRADVTIAAAAARTGLAKALIQECVRLGLVSAELNDADLADLDRVHRLTELGLDLVRAKVVLRMRRQVTALLEKVERQRGREKVKDGLKSCSSPSSQAPAIGEESN